MLLSLHNDIARIGLESPTDRFLSYVNWSLDFWRKCEQGEPDLIVRHVEKLTLPEPPLLLGDAGGCAGDVFFIRDHDGSRAALPLGNGGIPEIVAERGFRPATLYVLAIEPFVQLALLKRGYTFVHSSAFELDGRRVLLAADGHVGKTSFLLRALAAGAQYLADDWSILSDEGDLLAYPRPLRLFEYNTEDLADIRRCLPVGRRALHAAVTALRHGYQRLTPSNSFTHRLVGRVVELAVGVSQVHMRADELFPGSAARPGGSLAVACFMTSWEGESLEVARVGAEQLSGRIAASYVREQARFVESFEQYAAVTGSTGSIGARTAERVREVATAALTRVPCCSAKIPSSMPRDQSFARLRDELMELASISSHSQE